MRWTGPIIFLSTMILVLADIFRGFWDHDSGYFFLQSLFMVRGLKPFIDYQTLYPPLYNLINAVPVILGIDRWVLTWLTPWAWILSVGLMTRVYWQKTVPYSTPWIGWCVGAVFPLFCIDFGGNHNTLELGIAFFGILSLYVFSLGQVSWRTYFYVGFCVACAFLVKQVGILLLLPYLTQVRRRSHLLSLLAGVFVPTLLCLAWLEFDVQKIIESSRVLGSYLGSTLPTHPKLLGQTFLGVLKYEVHRTPPGLVFIGTTFVLGFMALVGFLKKTRFDFFDASALWIAAWGALASAYIGARLANNFPHYTINAWPALVVLLVAGFQNSSPRTLRGAGASAWVAVVLLFATVPDVRDMQGKPYFRRWAERGQMGLLLRPAGRELKSLISGDSVVTQLGLEESVLFFLADRLPINKDWAGYDLQSSIIGDGIVFADYGQVGAQTRILEIEAAGYRFNRHWAERWGRISLYWKTGQESN